MRSDIPWYSPHRMTLSYYTDEQLIRELEKRGYTVTQEEEEV